MELNVVNQKQKRLFYILLPIYKHIYRHLNSFHINASDEEINEIIKAISIKKRKERIEFVYDGACEILDNQFNGCNICGFNNYKCLAQQSGNCNFFNGCCRRCVYQSTNGCKTSNLTCKLFYCCEVTNKYKVLQIKDLKILKVLSFRQKIILKHDYFTSREDVIRDLQIGSPTIFIIRTLYRFFTKNIVKKRHL